MLIALTAAADLLKTLIKIYCVYGSIMVILRKIQNERSAPMVIYRSATFDDVEKLP